MNLESKVAIITGGGQGIGKAIARQFLQAGATVVIAEVDPGAGKETETEYSSLGEIKFIQTDVANEANVKRTITQTVESFSRLDILA